jgi:hypothetical protein
MAALAGGANAAGLDSLAVKASALQAAAYSDGWGVPTPIAVRA